MYLSILHHGLLPTGQTPHGLLLNVRPNNSVRQPTGPRAPVPKCNYPHWSSISDPSLTS